MVNSDQSSLGFRVGHCFGFRSINKKLYIMEKEKQSEVLLSPLCKRNRKW